MNAIVVNGHVGKELTLEYLNKMLIQRSINVMYLKLNESGEINDILINDKRVEHYIYKEDEIIFDEFDMVSNMYEKYKCDVLIVKSSKYNLYYNIILYVISRCDKYTLPNLRNDSFLTKPISVITAMQPKEIMNEIWLICNNLGIVPFISEHFHLSYIKYDTGLNMDYSYLGFALALNISHLFENIIKNNGKIINSYKRVKMYNSLFYKPILPLPLEVKTKIDNNYYMKTIEKYNVRFYCNSIKTESSTIDIINWFNKSSSNKNIKICMFHISPSFDLIEIVNNLCTVKYSSVYIIDYKEEGFSYKDLGYIKTYNIIPDDISNWTETIYEAFAKKVNRNITIDNSLSIVDWIFKYAGLHNNLQFDVLCVGSKKMIDDIISKIN